MVAAAAIIIVLGTTNNIVIIFSVDLAISNEYIPHTQPTPVDAN